MRGRLVVGDHAGGCCEMRGEARRSRVEQSRAEVGETGERGEEGGVSDTIQSDVFFPFLLHLLSSLSPWKSVFIFPVFFPR